jgi:hypothetical protein
MAASACFFPTDGGGTAFRSTGGTDGQDAGKGGECTSRQAARRNDK